MKYIRTKDRILEKVSFTINGEKKYGAVGVDSLYSEKDIIKEADTIEELCDGLIVEEKNNTWNWFVMEIIEFKELDKEERLYRVKDWNFNAFIQTDKGLIYVAKMNEKGVLELI